MIKTNGASALQSEPPATSTNILTIFAIPKAFHGHIDIIQQNAIRSWTHLKPAPRLILFGSDHGTQELANELHLEHIPDVATSELGTPLVQDVFKKAREMSKTKLLCYINSDIVLMSDFMTAVERCEKLKEQFLLCGRRWNLDITERIEFLVGWEERLKANVKSFGVLEQPWAIDYFVFTSKVGESMPPFIIGRPAWDNWFLYSARSEGYPLIDATQSILAVHQNHDYHHVPQGSGKTVDGPEAQINIKLAGPFACDISIKDATHTLINGQLKRTLDRESLIRKLDMTPRIKPWTAPFISFLRFLLRITKPLRVLISKPDAREQ